MVVLAFVILVFSAGEARYEDLTAESSRAHATIDAAEDALSALKDAETGQRGFVITTDPAYLAPYQDGVRAWSESLRALARLSDRDAAVAGAVERLRQAGAAKLKNLEGTIRTARRERSAAFVSIEQGSGKRYMDDARRIGAGIVRREEARYSRLSLLSMETESRTRWSVEAATGILFLFTLAGTLLLEREIGAERLLAGSLEASERKYRELAASLDEQVRQRTRELEDANEELQAFTWSVSHDLRAPLRAVDGFSNILMEDHSSALDAAAQELLSRIRGGVRRMGQLIHSLLDLSRVSRVEIRRQPVSISDLANSIVEGLRSSAPGREVEIRIEPHLTTEGDPNLMRIVLDNLLSNAWKFTARTLSARIEVGSQLNGNAREFYVRDNGAGFDPAFVDKLFKPFQRLHSEAEFEGTGIGLATAQRVIRRHGGTIRAEGNRQNGATFYFTLWRDPNFN